MGGQYFYRAGTDRVEDHIARVLCLHPEMIYVSEDPITMKFNKDNEVIYSNLPEECNHYPYFSYTTGDNFEGEDEDGNLEFRDMDIVIFVGESYAGNFGKLEAIAVYKKAKISKVRKLFLDKMKYIKEWHKKNDTWVDKYPEEDLYKEASKMIGIDSEFIIFQEGTIHIDISEDDPNNKAYMTSKKFIKAYKGTITEKDIVIAFSKANTPIGAKIDFIMLNKYGNINTVSKIIKNMYKSFDIIKNDRGQDEKE